jgi:16S rRNA (guanine966-N2)-methyltransferase
MRIVAGAWRSRPLEPPPGAAARPTADRVREALFSALASRLEDGFSGIRVADVFAGTGALGLEALSRGAAHVTFFEQAPAMRAVLERNIARFAAQARCRVVAGDARKPPVVTAPMDLVLLDPPYGQGGLAPAMMALWDAGWIGPETLMSVERSATGSEPLTAEWQELSDRNYGAARITLLKRRVDDATD